MRVLVACEYSGRVRDAFAKRGHDAWSVDLLPTDVPGNHYQGSIFDCEHYIGALEDFDLLIAHPPCTRLANSGVRWLHVPPKGKTKEDMQIELIDGSNLYNAIRDIPIKRKCIENPIMHKYARKLIKPVDRQIVQPWWFGEKAFKATGFELVGLSELTPTNKLDPPEKGTDEYKKWSAIHYASPGPDRWKIRSTTFQGVADAMADKYQVKKKNNGKREYWIVVTKSGYIANGYEHKTEKQAQRHCENVNAYC